MRMTRAQAAALAAAGDDVVDQHNDQLDGNNEDLSTKSSGESGEREALAELTHFLDTNDDKDTNAVPGEDVDEPEEQKEEQETEKKSEQEEINSDKNQDQGISNTFPTTTRTSYQSR